MNRFTAALMILLSSLCPGLAVAGNQDRTGTAGAAELFIPVGARGIAMGAASNEFINGVEALYFNPAGLSRMSHGVEGLFSHMSYIADVNVEYGAIGISAGSFGFLGFSLKSVAFGDIPVTTEDFPDGTGQLYSPTFLNIGATYSNLLTDRISVGVTATLISEKIMSTSASGIALSAGVQYSNLGVQGLGLSVVVKNIGPNMRFDGSDLLRQTTGTSDLRGPQLTAVQAASFELPSAIEIGIGYQRKFDDLNTATIGGMFRNNNSTVDEYAIGAEYCYNDLLFLRGGYTFAPQATTDLAGESSYIYDYTLGAGLHSNVGGVDLSFDYAYRHVKYFSGNQVVTLRFGF